MTTLSELFPQASSLPGGITKNPRFLPIFDGTAALNISDSSSTTNGQSGLFWAEVDRIGAYATTSTDDTYTTVCDITGAGFMFHLISQNITNTTDDVSFRITVDGVETVITCTQTWQSAASAGVGRVALGMCGENIRTGVFATSGALFHDYGGSADSVNAFSKNSGTVYLLPPDVIWMLGAPMLRFDESLKAEVKVTDVFPTNNGQNCGVTYILD